MQGLRGAQIMLTEAMSLTMLPTPYLAAIIRARSEKVYS